MELKLKYTVDEADRICALLRKEMRKAEDDYIRKKKAKGETIDHFKMQNAINQRKNIKKLGKLCLASVLSCGNILDKPEVNRFVEHLEREVSADSSHN